jgi:hypothetical protein
VDSDDQIGLVKSNDHPYMGPANPPYVPRVATIVVINRIGSFDEVFDFEETNLQ